MCGIAGEISFGNGEVSAAHVKTMCARLVHRGPDEEGFHISSRAVLGSRRLKVIGLVNGSQPVYNASETAVCVFNGEIYNYLELKSFLISEGYVFKTNTDAEVIVHLYDKFGASFVRRLRGMFAIAIYDTARDELLLAKDITGKKPLNYYRAANGSVIFSSELDSLISHPRVPRKVDREAVDRFMSFRVIPVPLTIYENVRKVEPATVLTFTKHGVTENKYWSFNFTDRTQNQSEAELVRTISDRLLEAVEIRLQSEVPLGALLSGGLDSSLIVALMSKLLDKPVHTFSIGFQDKDFNELRYSRLVSDYCHTIQHEYLITPDSALNVVDKLLRHFGEPYAFPSAIACYFMNQLAKQHVTVVLTGDGADEIFCGYNRYKLFDALPRLPESDHSRAKIDLGLLQQANGDIAVEYQAVLTDGLRDSLKRRLYAKSFIEALPGEFPVNYLRERFARNEELRNRLDRAMEVDCNFWLRDAQLVKIDITSMSHSVEIRCPMLDQKLIELVTGIGVKHKLVNGDEKRILKLVANDYLPPEIINRKKQELAVPLENWLTSALRGEITEMLLSDEVLSHGYFDPDALIEFIKNYGPADSYAVWTLYIFARWHHLAYTGDAALAELAQPVFAE